MSIPSQFIFPNSSIIITYRASSMSLIKLFINSELKSTSSFQCESNDNFLIPGCCSEAGLLPLQINNSPFQIVIQYYHSAEFPEEKPCFSLKLKSVSDQQMILGEEYVNAPTLLRSSPIEVIPLLNSNLLSSTLSKVKRKLHTNVNSKKQIQQNQLQLGVSSIFTLHPFDIYNNSLIKIQNFTFTIKLQSSFIQQSNCSYNTLEWLYYCSITPNSLNPSSIVIQSHETIFALYSNLTVKPGPFSLTDFTINDPAINIQTCIAGVYCIVSMTARDSFGNPINNSPLLNSQFDAYLIGPTHYETPLRHAIFNITNNGVGIYYLRFVLTLAGTFQLNILIDERKMFNQPKLMTIHSADVSPFRSLILGAQSSYRAGEEVLLQISLRDQFSNQIGNGVPLLAYFSQFPLNNVTIAMSQSSFLPLNLTFSPLHTGFYQLKVQILYKQLWTNINGSPLSFKVHASFPSTTLSKIQGPGTETISLISNNLFYMRIFDIYNNTYDKERIGDKSIYKVQIFGNSSYQKPISLQYSQPSSGYYIFSYGVTFTYESITIHASIYNESAQVYQPLNTSPLVVGLNSTHSIDINDYMDLLLYNIGVTSNSEVIFPSSQDSIQASANNIEVDVIPRSLNGSLYFYPFYGNQVRIVEFQLSEVCICKNCNNLQKQSLAGKNCRKFDSNLNECLLRKYCQWSNKCSVRYCSEDCTNCESEPLNLGEVSFCEQLTSSSYKLKGSLTKSGNYTAIVSVWSFGGLRGYIYENPDFTNLQTSFILNWLDHTFDQKFHSFFHSNAIFSMRLFGKISALFSEPYQIVIGSNLNCKIYLNSRLIFQRESKDGKPRTQKVKIELERYKLYDFQIELVSKKIQSELQLNEGVLQIKPYALLKWSSPSQSLEVVKPRSLFNLNYLSNFFLKIIPGEVSIAQTEIIWPNQPYSEYYANQTYTVLIIPRDIYGNSRIPFYNDEVVIYFQTENKILESTVFGVKEVQYYKITFKLMEKGMTSRGSVFINGVIHKEHTIKTLR